MGEEKGGFLIENKSRNRLTVHPDLEKGFKSQVLPGFWTRSDSGSGSKKSF